MIVDATGKGAAPLTVYYATGTVVFQGLTFQNGNPPGAGSSSQGGGLLINNSSPAFFNCVFQSNTAFNGGGAYLIASNASCGMKRL